MSSLTYYMTNGSFESDTHTFRVPPPGPPLTSRSNTINTSQNPLASDSESEFRAKRNRKLEAELASRTAESQLRNAVLSTRLLHSNLSIIQYNVFFQACKALGIGFDVRVRA